ncbi:MAG TPA: YihY/virulence factor BrkB family protein [Thermoanaerobaculia bacterium]
MKRKRLKAWKEVLAGTFRGFGQHRCMTESGALAFYTLFSLAPILIVAIAIGSAFFGEETVRGLVVRQFDSLMGGEQAELVRKILERVARQDRRGIGAIVGGLIVLFGASAVFAQLQSTLNRIWGVEPRRGHMLRSLVQKRIASFALILGIGFLLLVSLALSAALEGAQRWVEMRWEVEPALLKLVNVAVSFLLFAALFAMIYRILPDREIAWRDVALGSGAASFLFVAGKWLFGLYIGKTAIATPYGTAGSLVVILLWVFFATSLLLLGAEFTRAYSQRVLGVSRETTPGARRVKRIKKEIPKKQTG